MPGETATECPECGEGLRVEPMSLAAWGADIEGGVRPRAYCPNGCPVTASSDDAAGAERRSSAP